MDIFQFLKEQMDERYKHTIIYGPPFQGKTKLAKLITDRVKGYYVDLLEVFQKNDIYKEQIDIFSPAKLINFIDENYIDEKCIIIFDHIDFLIHTWDENQFMELISFIEMNNSGYCIVFIMQDYKYMSKLRLFNEKGNSRINNIFNVVRGSN